MQPGDRPSARVVSLAVLTYVSALPLREGRDVAVRSLGIRFTAHIFALSVPESPLRTNVHIHTLANTCMRHGMHSRILVVTVKPTERVEQ